MVVSILGVFVGGVVDIFSTFILAIPFFVYLHTTLTLEQRAVPHAISNAIHANPLLYASQFILGMLCSILGGFVAAAIAKRHERLNGALSSWLCTILGVLEMISGLSREPIWLQVLMLMATPMLALAGGELRSRMHRDRVLT